jgi:hypothetical protein
MFKPSTYLVVTLFSYLPPAYETYFPTYPPRYETYFLSYRIGYKDETKY